MKTKYYSTVVESAFERLWDEIFDGDASHEDIESVLESMNGDASHLPSIATAIGDKVIVGAPLTALDRYWLGTVLSRIADDKDTARAVAGKTGRGAPKGGARSLLVAQDVLDHILLDEDTTTRTLAWEKVSARHHLSIETVREYWAARKMAVCCSRQEALGLDGDEEIEVEDAIIRVLRSKREKRDNSSPEVE